MNPELAMNVVGAQRASEADFMPVPTTSSILAEARVVAIVGSRNYPELERVERLVDQLDKHAMVVSGGAQGVDRLAMAAALRRGLLGVVIRPEGDRGQFAAAAVQRDRWFGLISDVVVAFWTGESSGTAHGIRGGLDMGKCIVVLPGHPPEVWVRRLR